MGIRNPVPYHRVTAVADPRAITNLVAVRLLIQRLVPDHCLARLAATAASTRAVQDIRILDLVPGHDRILEIAGVVIAVILVALVQDAADMYAFAILF